MFLIRRLVLVLLLALTAPHVLSTPAANLRAGAEVSFQPYSDVDDRGEAVGFSVELLRAVAQVNGTPVGFRGGSWDSVWEALTAGELDVLPLVARLKEREGLVEFTAPHTFGYDSFFVRKGSAAIASIENARRLSVIAMQSDAAHQELVARGFTHQLVLVDNLAEGFRLLASGQHDALLAPVLQGSLLTDKLSLGAVIEHGPLLNEYRREFCFAVRRGDVALRDRLEHGIAQVKASGEYDRLYRKWLGIYEVSTFPRYYLWSGAAIAALLLSLLGLWTRTLRRQVAARTAELRQANAALELRVAERTAKLTESEHRFRTLAAAAFEGIAVTESGKVLDLNDRLAQILGYERDDIVGRNLVDFVAPEDRDLVLARTGNGNTEPYEHQVLRQDGSRRMVEVHGQGIEQDGRRLRLTAIQDITEHKRAEQALMGAKQAAEQANAAKSRFLAAASHDLRQPLGALALYVGLLEKKLPDADRILAHNMRDCVGNLSALLGNLLDISKLETGAVHPEVRDFALAEMLARLASTHRPTAEAKGLRFRVAGTSLHARTDAALFERIVGNFIANAVFYTERGGVLVGLRRRDGKRWIEVWDTGIGIADDQREAIFEEFYQIGNSERNREQGSGLGLAIAARSAQLLDLRIRLRSRPGRGSLFAVELPVGKAQAATLPACPAVPGRLRVGLVEDDPSVFQALIYALTEVGHDVVAAANSAELLRVLQGVPPDILISDYSLAEGENGLKVVHRIRGAFRRAIPAVIMTGNTDAQLAAAIAAEGIEVAHKPLDLAALQRHLARLTVAAAST